MGSQVKLTGGTPITQEIAIELRKTVFGSAAAPPRGEWTRTAITFGAPRDELPYGLRSSRNGTRGLQSVLQSFIIKYLLFDRRNPDQRTANMDVLLKPTESQQTDALMAAMCEIIWTIGEKSKAIIVLPGELPHVVHSHTYFQDSVTERLFLFELTNKDALELFLKKYLYFFTEEPGCGALLFLYSAVLTRTPTKVITDLDAPKGAYLMGHNEEGSLNIVTLLLTGRATPYLHNGVVYVGDEHHYALPQFGILARSSIGLLILENDTKNAGSTRQPGSRLKTPNLPIWIASCCGHFGVLFNSNRELLRNYHAEKRFELHYYTCAGCYVSMVVDNRALEEPPLGSINQSNSGASGGGGGSGGSSGGGGGDVSSSPIERLIHTKWDEAKVVLKGSLPASMSY